MRRRGGRCCRVCDSCRRRRATTATPVSTDPDDHCETPLEAYADVVPFLTALASRLGVHPAKLRVYDPYFCAGGVKDRLGLLGYGTVFNACRDAYADWDTGSFPDHDVLVTNPPYSDDHMEKLVRFVARRGKPFALLMPNFGGCPAKHGAVFVCVCLTRSRMTFLCCSVHQSVLFCGVFCGESGAVFRGAF